MRTIIVGAGVSGLVCAIVSARLGKQVTVLEAESRVGKKISMTGNGKCNLDNVGVNTQCYNDDKVAKLVLDNISYNQCMDFWHSIGLLTYTDSVGRTYPITDNANSVVDCLRQQCSQLNIEIICNQCVTAVEKLNKGYKLTTQQGVKFVADDLILACGSYSQSKYGGYNLLPNQYITTLQPSLTPIVVKNAYNVLNGIRQKCNATLYYKNNLVKCASGEVLFRDYGLSGICIMDLSASIARAQLKGVVPTDYRICIDLLPTLSYDQLRNILSDRLSNGYNADNLLLGILHNKLAEVVIKNCGKNSSSADWTSRIVQQIKNMNFAVERLQGLQYSQVTAGGVDSKFIDDNLRLPSGIAVLGEMLNVDGQCGGYNIHFATASALYFCNKVRLSNE